MNNSLNQSVACGAMLLRGLLLQQLQWEEDGPGALSAAAARR